MKLSTGSKILNNKYKYITDTKKEFNGSQYNNKNLIKNFNLSIKMLQN